MSLINKYKVDLDVFAGPLDLLLHLIKKNEVDIYDIPISTITDKYLEYIEYIKSLNLDLAGEFLVMAATLTHIKSKMLLPLPEVEEEEDDGIDPREELMRRLIAYRMFKEASLELIDRKVLGRDVFRRGMPVTLDDIKDSEVEEEEEELAIDSTLFDLMDAFKDVLKRFPKNYTLDLTVDRFRLTDKINYIMDKINTDKSVAFEELFPNEASRGEVIVTFLAILELAKSLVIKVFQGDEGVIRLYASSDETRKLDLIDGIIDEYAGGPSEYDEDDGEEGPIENREQNPEEKLEEELEKEIEAELDSELGEEEEIDIESLQAKARELIEEELAEEALKEEERREKEEALNDVEAQSTEDVEESDEFASDSDLDVEGSTEVSTNDSIEPEPESESELESIEDNFKKLEAEIDGDLEESIEDEDLEESLNDEEVLESSDPEETAHDYNSETVEEVLEEQAEESQVETDEVYNDSSIEEPTQPVLEEEQSVEIEEETEVVEEKLTEPEQSATEQSATEESATDESEPEYKEPEVELPTPEPETSTTIDNLVADLESDKLKGIASSVENEVIEEPVEVEETVKPKRSVFGAMWKAVTKVTKKIVNMFTGRG